MLNPFISYLWAAACERNTTPSGSCKLCRREVGVRGEQSATARMLKSNVLQAHVEGEHDENKYYFVFNSVVELGPHFRPDTHDRHHPHPGTVGLAFRALGAAGNPFFHRQRNFLFHWATPVEEQVRLVNSYPQLSLLLFIMVPNKHQ